MSLYVVNRSGLRTYDHRIGVARLSAVALVLLTPHAVLARIHLSGIALMRGKDYPVCRAVAGGLHRLGLRVGPTDWITHMPAIRGVTQPVWTPVADASAIASNPFPFAGVMYGPAEETTIPHVVIQTPPAMGTATSVTIDLHLVRRAMEDDGTGRFSDVKGHRGEVMGWSFQAVNLNLFPGVTHVHVGIGSVPATVFLWGGQPWFGDGLGELGSLTASPALGPREHAGFLIREDECSLTFIKQTTSP